MALTRIKTDQIADGQVTSADLASGLTLTGPTGVDGKMLIGNEIDNANLVNVVDFTKQTGIDAYRPINLIDTSAAIKVARITDNPGNDATLELSTWLADISQNTSFWDVYAGPNGMGLRDRNPALTRNRIFLGNSGNVIIGSTSGSPATSAGEVTANGVTNILQVQGNSYFSSSVGIGTTTPGAPLNVVANTSTDAVRITQTGTGNAFVVEDSASPDATPFVIDASGNVISGYTVPFSSGLSIPAQFGVGNIGSGSGAGIVVAKFRNSSAVGADIELQKSRVSTVGGNTIANSGDLIGAINWTHADGTGYTQAASISAAVDGTPGTNNMPGRLVFSTTPAGSATPVERMRIGSAGAVMIGATSAPSQWLNISRNGPPDGSSNEAIGVFANVNGTSVSTVAVQGYRTFLGVQAGASTSAITHYYAVQGTISGTATNQFGFRVFSNLTGATNNFGFYSDIAAATGRWNFYANGTAPNYFRGDVTIDGTLTVTNNQVVQQSDIGTAPNKIPLNQYLGELAYMNKAQVVISPQATAVPAAVRDMVFELTNDTTLTIKVKGSDGVVRSVALTLA
jgi:hypothetical protein